MRIICRTADPHRFTVGPLRLLQPAADPGSISEDQGGKAAQNVAEGIAFGQTRQRLPGVLSRARIALNTGRVSTGGGQSSPHNSDNGSRFKSGIESREHALSSVENRSDLLLLARERQHPTFQNREPGMCRRKWRNGLEPSVQSDHLARHEQQASIFLDQSNGALRIPSHQGMMDRLRDESPLLKPLGCADVQIVNLFRHHALEMLVEHVREKVMVAVPVPIVIEGNQKQVPAFQFLQDRLTVNPFPGLSDDCKPRRAGRKGAREWRS